MTAFLTGRKALVVFAIAFAALSVYLVCGVHPQEAQQRNEPPKGSRFAKFSVGDAITADIRNKSRELARVEINSPEDRTKAETLGTIVEDFGSFVVLSKGKKTYTRASGLRLSTIDGKVHLPGAQFDPVVEQQGTAVSPESADGLPDSGYYVVQFGGVATDEWIESLRDAGVEVLQYLPENAFLIYGDRSSVARAAGHSRVRWAGRFAPEHKVPDVLKEQLSAEKNKTALRGNVSRIEKISAATAVFDIAVFSRADLDRAAADISSSGARILKIVRLSHNYFNLIRAELPIDAVEQIAAIPDVIRIDAWSKPVKEDERAADIVAGNYTSTSSIVGPGYDPLSQFGVNGQGVTVSVVDDGVTIGGLNTFYMTTANTVNGPLRGAPAGATGGHGHLNASIIAGSTPFAPLDPLGYNYGLGIAPAANIINIPLLVGGYSGSEADTYNDTITTAGLNGRVGYISNNSWGSGSNNSAYDSYTAQFDGFVRDAAFGGSIEPIVLVFSAGNDGVNGPSTLTRPKAAKNIIAVGNSENLRPEFGAANADNMDDLRSSSSRGPTADGRIKPDIIAPGSYVTGSRGGPDCSSVTSCFDANHAYSIGTSHSAPQVTGAAALFTQFWRDGHLGQNPRPALVKAAIINSGQEMSGLNTNGSSLPNGNEGWGRINLDYVLSTGVPMKYVNESEALSNVGDSYSISGSVGNAAKPVRISLVWTDPPAAADPALVNNLNLTVTVNGTTYRGNVFSGGRSTTGGSADSLNNVENVWLPAGIPAGAPVTIQVTAAALNGDGILGNNDSTDQNFAIVAYNVGDAVAPTAKAIADFDGDHKTDLSIFRPSTQTWWINRSSDGNSGAVNFGAISTPGVPVPADYTGDGKTDVAVWRASDGTWLILRSEDSSYYSLPFGSNGDIPAPGDFDGDGKADPTIFRPSTGAWYSLQSSGGVSIRSFGTNGDQPVVGDYNGDGVSDTAIYRSSVGQWWISMTGSGSVIAYTFGTAADRAVPGDYTGDGRTDVAIWRPSNGNWYILRSEDASYYSLPFGSSTDLPAPGDYDGDGKTDTAVFRPSTGTWFVNRSTAGILITNFGSNGDAPAPGAFVR